MLYIIEKMLINFKNSSLIRKITSKYDFYFTPLSNPDGYEYSITNDRTWRKNRRANKVLNKNSV